MPTATAGMTQSMYRLPGLIVLPAFLNKELSTVGPKGNFPARAPAKAITTRSRRNRAASSSERRFDESEAAASPPSQTTTASVSQPPVPPG